MPDNVALPRAADEAAVVTKAVLRAAERLALPNRVLAATLGLSEATISRMGSGTYRPPDKPAGFWDSRREAEHSLNSNDCADYALGFSSGSANSPSTKSSARNRAKSSIRSPTPTNFTGILNCCRMGMTTPPIAVPSSFAKTIPVHPAASENPLAWLIPF